MANQDSVQDSNRIAALIAHTGTAGTAETRRITSSGTPGGLDVYIVGTGVEIGGVASGTNVNIVTGTLDEITNIVGGTLADVVVTSLPDVPGGTIDEVSLVVAGTLEDVTVTTLPDIPGGTVDLVARVSNLGTLESGTIAVLPDLPGGTVDLVSAITTGSIVVTAGTTEDTAYALKVDGTTTSDVTYVGEAAIGVAGTVASWRIKKIDETTADMVDITWADGDGSFDNLWSGRGTISYS